MFTRQKYLIAYLSAAGGQCSHIQLDKGLFWLSKEKLKTNIYDFHPYLFGPFSETLYLDLRTLGEKGLLAQDKENVWLRTSQQQNKKFLDKIPSEDFYEITLIASEFAKMSFNKTLEKVYTAYPYFAINNPNYKNRFRKHDPRLRLENKTAKIFTIGYEGISIDEFLNQLIRNNIHILVDVRNNPHSMKYGFSEKKLESICGRHGIEYLSIRNLGIVSDKRQMLETAEDYKKLFADFEKNHMPKVSEELGQLQQLLEGGKRIALMCFEKDISCCHREVVGRHLYHFSEAKYGLQHL